MLETMNLPEHIDKAIDHYIPRLGNWLDTHRAKEMAELIIQIKPKTIVEIGSFKGQSTVTMGFALRENNDGGKLYAIDPWKVEYAAEGDSSAEDIDWWSNKIDLNIIHQDCMSEIWSHHLDRWVVVIRAASQNCYELFHDIDLLYIDGCHSEVASTRDVENYVPKVKSGGYIIMDDCDWPTTKKAVNMVEEACKLDRDYTHYKYWIKK